MSKSRAALIARYTEASSRFSIFKGFDTSQLCCGVVHYKNGKDLIPQITSQESADFFKALMKSLSVTLSLRHNNGEKGDKEQDYILSPVADSKGNFYDSRKADNAMPKDADANGAYHIALKGLWCLEQINKAQNLKKVNLAMSNKEWLQFKQSKV
jgi:CRISPR-associated protein Cpf1